MIIPYRDLFLGQLICTVVVFSLALALSAIWEELLENDTIHSMFTGKSATFDLLNIVVGFSYVNLTRDFIGSMLQYTHLYSQIKLQILTMMPNEQTIRKLFEVSNIDPKWKDLRDKYWIMVNDESGMIFNLFGPYLALLLYFVIHPPLVRTSQFWEWAVPYSVSVTVLFAFILNLAILERFILPRTLKQKALQLIRKSPMSMNEGAEMLYRPNRSLRLRR